MEITLLIMENHGIVFLNFCGNLVNCIELFFGLYKCMGAADKEPYEVDAIIFLPQSLPPHT